jgi:hypothetical protein
VEHDLWTTRKVYKEISGFEISVINCRVATSHVGCLCAYLLSPGLLPTRPSLDLIGKATVRKLRAVVARQVSSDKRLMLWKCK